MTGTKEFYEIMDTFEKEAKNIFYGHKVERYSKDEEVPAGQFYTDGFVNTVFIAFLHGYQYRKSVE